MRVAVLGGSMTRGHGVGSGERWSDQFEQLLSNVSGVSCSSVSAGAWPGNPDIESSRAAGAAARASRRTHAAAHRLSDRARRTHSLIPMLAYRLARRPDCVWRLLVLVDDAQCP